MTLGADGMVDVGPDDEPDLNVTKVLALWSWRASELAGVLLTLMLKPTRFIWV